jgi:hypothetical protein
MNPPDSETAAALEHRYWDHAPPDMHVECVLRCLRNLMVEADPKPRMAQAAPLPRRRWKLALGRGHCAQYPGTNVETAAHRNAIPDLSHRDTALSADLNQHTWFNGNRQSEAHAILSGIKNLAFKMRTWVGLKDRNYRRVISREPDFRPPFPSRQGRIPPLRESVFGR